MRTILKEIIVSKKPLDYTALDAAIVSKIGRVGGTSALQFHAIFCDPDVGRACKALAAEHNGDHQSNDIGYKDDWRFLDSRLQALKRAGRIRFSGPSKGWLLCAAQPAQAA